MKKLHVIAQDSALDIKKEKVIAKIDPSIKESVIFGRFPFTPPSEVIEQMLKTLFEGLREIDPECYILLMTSSRIYDSSMNGDKSPDQLSTWLKANFKNTFYAVRSAGGFKARGDIDFGFDKNFNDIEQGIADNILEVYKKIPQ